MCSIPNYGMSCSFPKCWYRPSLEFLFFFQSCSTVRAFLSVHACVQDAPPHKKHPFFSLKKLAHDLKSAAKLPLHETHPNFWSNFCQKRCIFCYDTLCVGVCVLFSGVVNEVTQSSTELFTEWSCRKSVSISLQTRLAGWSSPWQPSLHATHKDSHNPQITRTLSSPPQCSACFWGSQMTWRLR